jgi:hypothetical protein
MLIDRTHRSWAIGSLGTLGAALLIYIPYARATPGGPRGGSALGLAYGVAGFALMLFAGLLAARKKVPVWRIGRAQTWMRGHLWLGLLSFPLILLHAGGRFGGPLTTVLMWLFVIVVVSGVAGAAFQHVLPRVMLREVPMETIYEQIPQVRDQLVVESDGIVSAACGALAVATDASTAQAAGAIDLATIVRLDADETVPLRDFYLREMRPFVAMPDAPHALADERYARQQFERLRTIVPAALHQAVDDLENIWVEERQLSRQLRLHRVLHGWLLVHVPLSFALLLLAVLHIVSALRY